MIRVTPLRHCSTPARAASARVLATATVTITAIALAMPPLPATADWPAFRGPSHDGTAPEVPPFSGEFTTVWTAPTELGFSSFSVADGRAFTLVLREIEGNPMEVCVALDAATGEELWAAPLGLARYDGGGNDGTRDNRGGDGPRSTPVIDGNRVFVIDAQLAVHCLQADSGDLVWQRDLVRDHNGRNIRWQNAASPLILDGRMFVAGGGDGEALMALDINNGEVIWSGEDDLMTHATPVPAVIHGVEQVVFFTQSGLVAVVPDDGEVLWRAPYRFNVSTAASPVVWEDIVYCSAGYGVGAGAFKISRDGDDWSAEELWRADNRLFNHWSTPVVVDGYLYGMYGFKQYGDGPVACVDIRTGEMKWEQEGFGPGQVILVGDQLLAVSDTGEVVLIDVTPDGYRETARQKVLEGKVWSYPVLAGGHVFVRSTEQGVALAP